MKPKHKPDQHKKQKSNLNSFLRYSGLAFEMLVVMLAGVFGGIKLDTVLNTSPLFTAILSMAGVVLALYFALKDFIRKP